MVYQPLVFQPDAILPALEWLQQESSTSGVYEHLSGVYVDHTALMPRPRFLIEIEVA